MILNFLSPCRTILFHNFCHLQIAIMAAYTLYGIVYAANYNHEHSNCTLKMTRDYACIVLCMG